MDSKDVLQKITTKYLGSRDFNGITIAEIGEDNEEVRRVLRSLLLKKQAILNFGDRHPNPHILAFEPEPVSEQVDKLDRLVFEAPKYLDYGSLKLQVDGINCCAYHRSRICGPSLIEGGIKVGHTRLRWRSGNLNWPTKLLTYGYSSFIAMTQGIPTKPTTFTATFRRELVAS